MALIDLGFLFFSSLIVLAGCSHFSASDLVKSLDRKKNELYFVGSRGQTFPLNYKTIRQYVDLKEITINKNPAYAGAQKKYRGFDLKEFLKTFDPSLNQKRPFRVEVHAYDGWKKSYPGKKILSQGALIAIRELRQTLSQPISPDGFWSMVTLKSKPISPSPYYIVWNDLDKNPDILPLQVGYILVRQMTRR